MKHLVRAAAISILVLPVFASAQSADITAQAQALMAQIAALQAQLGVTSSPSGGSGVCYSGGTAKPGSSGATVTALQTFLAADPSIYPEGKITGYYGGLTQAAVQRWQAKNGIVSSGSPSTTGYGSVGPRTAAAMAASCGGGGGSTSNDPIVGGFINVSPITGEPPLHVSVDTTINTVKSCLAATYTLSWGDGSQPIVINIPANKCDVLAQTYTHTYNLGGEYTISLTSGIHQTTSVVTVNGGGGASLNGSSAFGGTSTGGSSTGGSASTGGSSSTGGSGTTQTASGALAINIGSGGFSPNVATVSSGTKVTWTNKDTTSHTVSADNGSYNSGTMQPGQTYSLTFTTKGEYTYYCAFHGSPGGVGMSGKIIVQ